MRIHFNFALLLGDQRVKTKYSLYLSLLYPYSAVWEEKKVIESVGGALILHFHSRLSLSRVSILLKITENCTNILRISNNNKWLPGQWILFRTWPDPKILKNEMNLLNCSTSFFVRSPVRYSDFFSVKFSPKKNYLMQQRKKGDDLHII